MNPVALFKFVEMILKRTSSRIQSPFLKLNLSCVSKVRIKYVVVAADSGMYRFPSLGPVIRRGALPYGPVARREGGERKGAVGWSGGLR